MKQNLTKAQLHHDIYLLTGVILQAISLNDRSCYIAKVHKDDGIKAYWLWALLERYHRLVAWCEKCSHCQQKIWGKCDSKVARHNVFGCRKTNFTDRIFLSFSVDKFLIHNLSSKTRISLTVDGLNLPSSLFFPMTSEMEQIKFYIFSLLYALPKTNFTDNNLPFTQP